jgi:hypothetical protein
MLLMINKIIDDGRLLVMSYGSGLEGGNRHGSTAVVSYPADWTKCRQRSR